MPWLTGVGWILYVLGCILAFPLYWRMEKAGETAGLPFRVAIGAPILLVGGGFGLVMLLNAHGKWWVLAIGGVLLASAILLSALWIRSGIRRSLPKS